IDPALRHVAWPSGDFFFWKEIRNGENGGDDDARGDQRLLPGAKLKHRVIARGASPPRPSVLLVVSGRGRFRSDVAQRRLDDLDDDIGAKLDHHFIALKHFRDFADQPARGDDDVAFAHIRDHLHVLFARLLLRADDQEIEEDENENEGRKLQERVRRGGAGGLRIGGRNEHRADLLGGYAWNVSGTPAVSPKAGAKVGGYIAIQPSGATRRGIKERASRRAQWAVAARPP